MSIKTNFYFWSFTLNSSADNANNWEENKNFCENYIYVYQFHYKDLFLCLSVCVCVCVCLCVCVCVCVENLKFFNLDTACEPVTPKSLLTLIIAGPLECYVLNMTLGVLEFP
jgi:hypothetical protein